MSNIFDDVVRAVNDARSAQLAVDHNVGKMVKLISGRLRTSKAWGSDLAELKRELRDFNMTTEQWKETK